MCSIMKVIMFIAESNEILNYALRTDVTHVYSRQKGVPHVLFLTEGVPG